MKPERAVQNIKLKTQRNHVLLIDDDEFLLNAMRKKLEMANYKVTVSTNVHDAHFKLSFIDPDLIILDIIMPDINGIEFMHLINEQYSLVNTPIILMSYLSKKKLLEMGYNIGLTRYLAKPFDINKLPLLLNKTIVRA